MRKILEQKWLESDGNPGEGTAIIQTEFGMGSILAKKQSRR